MDELEAFIASLPPPSPSDLADVIMWLADHDQSGEIDAEEGLAFVHSVLPKGMSDEEINHVL